MGNSNKEYRRAQKRKADRKRRLELAAAVPPLELSAPWSEPEVSTPQSPLADLPSSDHNPGLDSPIHSASSEPLDFPSSPTPMASEEVTPRRSSRKRPHSQSTDTPNMASKETDQDATEAIDNPEASNTTLTKSPPPKKSKTTNGKPASKRQPLVQKETTPSLPKSKVVVPKKKPARHTKDAEEEPENKSTFNSSASVRYSLVSFFVCIGICPV